MTIKYIEYSLFDVFHHEHIIEIDSINQLEEKILDILHLETDSAKIIYNEEIIDGPCYCILDTPFGKVDCRFGELQVINNRQH